MIHFSSKKASTGGYKELFKPSLNTDWHESLSFNKRYIMNYTATGKYMIKEKIRLVKYKDKTKQNLTWSNFV